MTDRLAQLVANPTSIAEMPVAEVPALLDAVTREAARLDVLKTVLAARLAVGGSTGHAKSEPPYTLQEAATFLLKSPTWLRRQARLGAVPCARKVGKSWVFPRADFRRFCERRQVG